jgi:hypothetical protein
MVDSYFSAVGVLAKHELLPAVIKLPPESARGRLTAESKSMDRDNRQAAMKAIGNMSFSDRRQLLELFLKDTDEQIREGAAILLGA